ncbi:MAG: LytR/AlgR family response regulator transcription factor [Alphaproteobacteria bacterium]
MAMNVLIIEDEPHTAQLLKEIIEQDNEFIVVNSLDSIADTVSFISKQHRNIDLIFLDINLADGHSFDIFKHIDISIPIVFCTAYDEFTLQAIKNNAVDYILKPFKDEEIHNALIRFKQLVGNIRNKAISTFSNFVSQNNSSTYQESFLTQQKEKSVVIYTKDIALFAIEYKTVYLYTFDKKKYPVFKNIEYVESVCDPKQFFRINRQMLINRNNIISIEPYFNRKVTTHLKVNADEKAIVSRLKVAPFKEWIETGQ